MSQAVAVAPVAEYEDGTLAYLPPERIHVVPGFNPRTFFDPKEHEDMIASARANGIIQSIVVRPDPEREGEFFLIAGERRLRAARAAALTGIPSIIRLVDERGALAIALIENHDRKDISPAEEAVTARKLLDYLDGDRAEAIRLLGWPKTKFEARLLLLHADPEVLQALAERRIKVGHAELLSQLPEVTQRGTLAKVIEQGITVEDLKARVGAFAQELACAVFDKQACLTCRHNSSAQASLFSEHIADGRCANRECYAQKTREAVEAKRADLVSRFNCVFLDVEKEKSSYTLLTVGGDEGVGAEQFAACKGCAKFGALLETAPGREGRVTEDVCFDLPCHKKKVEAARVSAAPAAKAGKSTGTATKTSKPKGAAKAPEASVTPKQVIEKVHAFLRRTAGDVVGADVKAARAVELYALYHDAGDASDVVKNVTGNLPGTSRYQVLRHFYGLDENTAAAVRTALAAYIAAKRKDERWGGNDMVKSAGTLIVASGIELAGRFKLDKEFLEAHTKAGIEALLTEARDPEGKPFPEWYNAKEGNDKAFKKLFSLKVDKLIETVLGCGFDFSKFVPSSVVKELAEFTVKNSEEE